MVFGSKFLLEVNCSVETYFGQDTCYHEYESGNWLGLDTLLFSYAIVNIYTQEYKKLKIYLFSST